MNNKKFDCVEMKREGAKIVMEKIKTMTREEELAYWRKRTKEMKLSNKRETKNSRPKRHRKSTHQTTIL